MASHQVVSLQAVNDVHSGLNPALMRVHQPRSVDELASLVARIASEGGRIAVCGGRHAMGGQQFLSRGELLDLSRMNRIESFDHERGLVRAQAGIHWPELINGMLEIQRAHAPGVRPRWGIRQKQTGADRMSLGGALSANIHGRGLLMAPIVSDVEAFTLVGADGVARVCSRTEHPELFRLAIGGYGLFGVIADVTLRLAPRRTLRRVVRVIDIEDAIHAAERRIREGALYGDFQFDIDPRSPDFLTKGVFSCYVPVEGDAEPPEGQRALEREDWLELLTLAHTDKTRAFNLYAQHYLATDGQLYESDLHQLSDYADGYHEEIERRTRGCACPIGKGSEVISELYVPPERLTEFLSRAAAMLSERAAQVIYGTIRLIQPDTETVLAWARERFACVIFNLHVDHTQAGIERASGQFRALIDLASELGGSYYLTYHKFATPEQLEKCYPRIRSFVQGKVAHDPRGVFMSDWFSHYSPSFASRIDG